MNPFALVTSDNCQKFYKFKTLMYHYAKTISLICLKLTVYNKDIIRNLNIKFLRNLITFYSITNMINIAKIVP